MNLLIGILITLLVFAVIAAVLSFLLDILGLDARVKKICMLVLAVICLIWLLTGRVYYGGWYHS